MGKEIKERNAYTHIMKMDQRGQVLEYSDDWAETLFTRRFFTEKIHLFRTNHVVVKDKGTCKDSSTTVFRFHIRHKVSLLFV